MTNTYMQIHKHDKYVCTQTRESLERKDTVRLVREIDEAARRYKEGVTSNLDELARQVDSEVKAIMEEADKQVEVERERYTRTYRCDVVSRSNLHLVLTACAGNH